MRRPLETAEPLVGGTYRSCLSPVSALIGLASISGPAADDQLRLNECPTRFAVKKLADRLKFNLVGRMQADTKEWSKSELQILATSMSLRISIVTISFNQAEYLRRTIESVLDQGYDNLQYIVVDPGSTDGSREIIQEYADRIQNIIFEPDQGAADGLNHGFEVAGGDVLGYLNSDDILLPGALHKVSELFSKYPSYDVISGHCKVIDARDKELRESYSDRFRRRAVLYRGANLMQPSTFFRKSAFDKTSGFNTSNRLDWDTELFLDMHAAGAKFKRCNVMLSGYRLHSGAVTSEDRTSLILAPKWQKLFQEKKGREWAWSDNLVRWGYLVLKYLREPRWIRERLLRGYVSGRTE